MNVTFYNCEDNSKMMSTNQLTIECSTPAVGDYISLYKADRHERISYKVKYVIFNEMTCGFEVLVGVVEDDYAKKVVEHIEKRSTAW